MRFDSTFANLFHTICCLIFALNSSMQFLDISCFLASFPFSLFKWLCLVLKTRNETKINKQSIFYWQKRTIFSQALFSYQKYLGYQYDVYYVVYFGFFLIIDIIARGLSCNVPVLLLKYDFLFYNHFPVIGNTVKFNVPFLLAAPATPFSQRKCVMLTRAIRESLGRLAV